MTSTRGIGVHWVYRCFDADGRLIYVGCTTNLPNRLEQHRTSSWWSPTVAKVTSKVYPDGPTGRAAEREAIRDEVPRWNKSGKWAGRSAWSQEDWHDWLTVLLRDGMSPQLANSVRDYESLFCSHLPEHLLGMYRRAQDEQAHRRALSEERDRQREKQFAERQTAELRELNEELSRTLDRQERLARALGVDWDDPDVDPEFAIEAVLREKSGA